MHSASLWSGGDAAAQPLPSVWLEERLQDTWSVECLWWSPCVRATRHRPLVKQGEGQECDKRHKLRRARPNTCGFVCSQLTPSANCSTSSIVKPAASIAAQVSRAQ